MRKAVFIAVAVLVFGVTNYLIADKEYIIRNGDTILLKLAPVDPRSLLQGDYMALDYALEREIPLRTLLDMPLSGELVIKPDSAGVAKFVRFHKGTPLAPDEHLLRYRRGQRAPRGDLLKLFFPILRSDGLHVAAGAFFFQEGHRSFYQRAEYGELKVSARGESVLVGLRDKQMQRLAPPQEKRSN